METVRTIAIIVAVVTGLDILRRFITGGINTSTYVFEARVLGAALGLVIADSPGDAIGTATGGFAFFALSALLFDIWLERPRN